MELMVTLGMSILLVAAVVSSFASAISFDKHNTEYLQKAETKITFEQRIRSLLRGAYVSPATTDTMTYFLSESTGTSVTSTSADKVTFTTLSMGPNAAKLTSDDDFETLNDNFGPDGGITEVSLSMSPVGDPGQDKQGVFLRVQRPADGDYSQGGTESLLSASVTSIEFEFYDGTDWITDWSTSGTSPLVPAATQGSAQLGQDARRIPAAVRVTYSLTEDPEGTTHSFVVQLLHSDVTAENPITTTGTGTTP
jgi:hypothetical protein